MDYATFNLSEYLPYRLALLSERVSRRLSLEYGKDHGLSVAEWRVLVHLARSEEVSIREIHTFANLDKPRVSRAVSRLEAEGLLRKEGGKEDQRLIVISLTDKGRKTLAAIVPDALAFESNLVQTVSPQEMDQFLSVVEKLHKVLDDDPLAAPRPPLDQ
ncbi:MarR family transcriptional regulator [Loktanella sp. IMCC34160]|uniref:MarR family winged helix-turn-helix transcriptional regulator n=1 Tax=Loktanella sp. IMCC34160 TaxID=2510646 RepID=UPI00101B965D|nr:MarR family winged helix-turn-helix transcriptional regulator [Loktanella sp. IMCC34160]RYG90303.1 MarR family transcriptional regulator [Loktanella sp. IMCC34160]